MSSKTSVRFGTTDEIATPWMDFNFIPAWSQNVLTCVPISSSVLLTALLTRQSAISFLMSNTPNTVCVFPMSTARSIGGDLIGRTVHWSDSYHEGSRRILQTRFEMQDVRNDLATAPRISVFSLGLSHHP